MLYLFTLLYIPISKVGIPHFYGRLIGYINDKKVIKAFHILIALIALMVFNSSYPYRIEYDSFKVYAQIC